MTHPSPDHPWRRNPRHGGKETYYNLSSERYHCMIASCKMIVRGLQSNSLYAVDDFRWERPHSSLEHVIRVRIAGKVYMMDRYLPAIAEELGKLLELHHWKFKNSVQKLCGIEYYIAPDWNYWIFGEPKS